MAWNHFPHYWPFEWRGESTVHLSDVSPDKLLAPHFYRENGVIRHEWGIYTEYFDHNMSSQAIEAEKKITSN